MGDYHMHEISEPFYSLYDFWYPGSQPAFYGNSDYELTSILESNSSNIINEIVEFYKANSGMLKSNFNPYGLDATGWNTVSLYGYGTYNVDAISRLPLTWGLLKDYPGLCMVMVSVLEPGMRLKAHFGDTDAIIRNHLGVVVPDQFPVVGIKIRTEARSWEVGKVLSFCVMNRHFAWNFSDRPRVVLIVDFVRPELLSREHEIVSKSLAIEVTKLLATRFPVTKRFPKWFLRLFHRCIALMIRIYTRIRYPRRRVF